MTWRTTAGSMRVFFLIGRISRSKCFSRLKLDNVAFIPNYSYNVSAKLRYIITVTHLITSKASVVGCKNERSYKNQKNLFQTRAILKRKRKSQVVDIIWIAAYIGWLGCFCRPILIWITRSYGSVDRVININTTNAYRFISSRDLYAYYMLYSIVMMTYTHAPGDTGCKHYERIIE